MITTIHCQNCGYDFEFEVTGKAAAICPSCDSQATIQPAIEPAPKQPAAIRPGSRLAPILISAAALIILAILAIGITTRKNSTFNLQPSTLEKWQYASIQWEDKRIDRDNHPGKILVTHIHIATDHPSAEGAQAMAIDTLLSAIGNYGWELVCYDGKNYIVKRPRPWPDGTFYLTDEWESIPK